MVVATTAALAAAAGGADAMPVSPLGGAPVPNPVPDANRGLHLTDANIALGNRIALVAEQAQAFAGR